MTGKSVLLVFEGEAFKLCPDCCCLHPVDLARLLTQFKMTASIGPLSVEDPSVRIGSCMAVREGHHDSCTMKDWRP